MMLKPHVILLLAAISLPAAAADLAAARSALLHGRVDEAEKSLRSILQSDPNSAEAHQLLCRVFYAQDQADPAIPECEAAVSLASGGSENQLWLGRVYGLKASHAGALSAFGIAKKTRAAFERAAQSAPYNLDAVISLGQFYVAAPGIVGGGVDKAKALAARVQSQSPATSHHLLALIAEKAKDANSAEAEYKSALAVSHTPDAYMDLALYYQTHNQPDEAFATVRSGIEADRAKGPALVDAASILTDAKRGHDLAEKVLRDYIASPNQTDAAPAFKAHLQLGKLLAQRGDTAGARRENSAALALAPNFAPARAAAKGV